tara:strand:+ start:14689 stop:15009 length:321 start_codon:yes stop_codon:yes gene_type:complete
MKRLILTIPLLCAVALTGFSGNAFACAIDDTTYVTPPVTKEHQTDGKPIFVATDTSPENSKGYWYCSDNDTDCKGFLKTAVQCEHHVNMLHTPEHKHGNHGEKHTH